MRKMLLLAVVATIMSASPAAAQYQDLWKPETGITLRLMQNQWSNHCFYMVGSVEKPKIDIEALFLGFMEAYPCDLTFDLLEAMLGYDMQGRVDDFILDRNNGFISGTQATECSAGLQMCYWFKSNGDILIAVALNGSRYPDDDEVKNPAAASYDDDYQGPVAIGTLMFFELKKGELRALPILPEKLTGQRLDYRKYYVILPRNGKNIELYDFAQSNKLVKTLRWNDGKFTVR